MSVTLQNYRGIVKATGILGGLQIVQILFSLIKSKFTAVFIGAKGLGILGLFSSTMNVFYSLASIGLIYSTTKEIASYSHMKNTKMVNKVFSLSQNTIIVSSFIFTAILIIFSNSISVFVFGTEKYSVGFTFLAFSIFFFSSDRINYGALQGIRKINELALSNILGGGVSLISTILLYSYLGENGIVPSLAFGILINFIISTLYIKRNKIKYERVNVFDFNKLGIPMIKLGLVMLVASLVGNIVTSFINVFISKNGSITDIGLYNAGISITTQYVSLIFSAISLDFFPKLSAISNDNKSVRLMVNDQSIICLLILFPILLGMVLTSKILIGIFLSQEFLLINNFVRTTSLFLSFQCLAFIISNIPLSKGDKKIFFLWNSMFPGICALIFFTVGYKYFGLIGLSIGSGIVNVFHFLSMLIVCKIKYEFNLNFEVLKILILSTSCISLTYFAVITIDNIIGIFIGFLFFCFSLIYTFNYLEKLIGIKSLFIKFLRKPN